jgi:hypothetical protein
VTERLDQLAVEGVALHAPLEHQMAHTAAVIDSDQ